MKIFLDSNVLYGDPFLSQNELKVLMLGKRSQNWDVFIPAIVFEELTAQFVNNFREKYESVKNIERKLSRWSEEETFHYQANQDYEQLKEKYKKRLKTAFAENGISLLPIPEVSHEEIVSRILEKKHPFKSDESGYRDYLIWKTIASMESQNEPTVLISNNTKDFGTEPRFHSDLLESIQQPLHYNFSIFNSIKSFNDKYLSHVKIQDSGKDDIYDREIFGNFSIKNWVAKEMQYQIEREHISEAFFGFIPSRSHASLSSVEKIKSLDVLYHYDLSDTMVMVEIQLKIMGSISVMIDGDEYQQSEELRKFVGVDEEMTSGETMWWDQKDDIRIKGSLSFNKKSGKYSEFEIMEISDLVDVIVQK